MKGFGALSIVEATEIEIVVEVEFVWWLGQVNAVLDFKVPLHSGLTWS